MKQIDASSARFVFDKAELHRDALRRAISNRLIYSMGKDPRTATPRDWLQATEYAVRERLIERWTATMRSYYDGDAKRVYYLSMEFLPGRMLENSLLNLGIYDETRNALEDLGLDLTQLVEIEPDPGLGNGGLGRLAACFLDSMATLSLPGYGYGIRYEYGMFRQRIERGEQIEHPEMWLRYGNPWEFARPEALFPVKFGGRVVEFRDERDHLQFRWVETDDVMAMAYDIPVPGYDTDTVNNLRLWSAKASRDFNLKYFNEGNYIQAVRQKDESESLSKVLYPNDTSQVGRELRLKQEYFFVSASLQDIVRRFRTHHRDLNELPDRVAIQLNDTHPSLAIPELMRVLVDLHQFEWDRAWDITRRTFSYTNHTLMPEALETWPVNVFGQVLPRHLQIIYEINQRFLDRVGHASPGDVDRVRRVSLVDEEGDKRLRMAHLALVGCHTTNGVSKIHTELLKSRIFPDFDALFPDAIVNVTNGITPRRWLHQANPELAALITRRIGSGWICELGRVSAIAPLAGDEEFRAEFWEVKQRNKARLAKIVQARLHLDIDPLSLFDVHAKRFHEYKRQLLNVLHVVARYNRIREQRDTNFVPRTVIFSGKASPAYAMAKLIIRLVHAVADVINHDPIVAGRLKVVFIPDYNVSTAERLLPAADLSEQISTAGTEASGTGNMKLALNGALTIGTLDGANLEIREAVGAENMFAFGLTADEASGLWRSGYEPAATIAATPELRATLELIAGGYFSMGSRDLFRPIVDALTRRGDHFLVTADFASYLAAQDQVDDLFRRRDAWITAAIRNVAAMGDFSSDRAVMEYATRIWRAGRMKPR